ncbi:MAG TPA: hypothetical protein VGR36_06840 [Candidatus Acidoferrales bacterium]|nr:hypothetical protein [Candidatus Acidoferrales bacterium]
MGKGIPMGGHGHLIAAAYCRNLRSRKIDTLGKIFRGRLTETVAAYYDGHFYEEVRPKTHIHWDDPRVYEPDFLRLPGGREWINQLRRENERRRVEAIGKTYVEPDEVLYPPKPTTGRILKLWAILKVKWCLWKMKHERGEK